MHNRQFWQVLCGGAAIVALATPAEAQVRSFSIPAGDLKSALDIYARQSGRQLIYRTDDVRGAHSRGAKGRLTPDGALGALLAGTGFSYRADASGAIAIVRSSGTDAVPLDQSAAATAVASSAINPAIVVTGSRIRSPNLESVVPITSVQGEQFFQNGRTAIGEVLNDLPSMRSTFTQTKSTRLGTHATGLNLLDLRGLGIDRTLVLQNGRRYVPAAPFTTAADVNTIPTELIDRVDIVTGGSSAIYGSDAIAGVVNFVLKRDFEGIQLRGQAGISRHDDAGQQFLSATAGTNFADGRGNVAASIEYSHQADWYASDRPSYRNLSFYLPVDADEPGSPNGSDGIPDAVLFTDIRYPFFSNGGTFIDFNNLGPDGDFPSYLFQQDGSLALQTGTRATPPFFGFFNGGNGSNLQEGKLFGYSPDLKRINFNLLAHYTVSPAFEPFIEAKYVHVTSFGSSSGSFFSFNNTWGPRENYFTDNPFLTSQTRDFLKQTMGLGPNEEGAFFYGRNFEDLGPLVNDTTRNTYRIVGGARGEIGGPWTYEVSANVAKVSAKTDITGNVNVQRFLLAIDAVRDPVSGNIICRSQIDPTAAVAYEGAADPAFAAARLAADVAACVPINTFGAGNISEAGRNYILTTTRASARLTQTVLNGFVSGDSSQWFELPGGPVGVALGAEYRRETFRDAQDELLQSGITQYTPSPPFDPPAFEVKEVFGELRAPILAHRPGAEELTLTAAGRLADYKGSTGTVFAWNLGAEWAPVRDLKLRINQSRAVRAPNLVERYQPLGQSFDNSLTFDPCSTESIGSGSPNRAANCRADGVPEGWQILYLTSFGFQSGGNPELREETSDSLTLGAIIQPRFLPGFSLSADYYDIKVNNVITSPGVQAILNSCYDASSIDNQFCALFERNPGPGPGPHGEEVGQIIENSLRVVPLNYAALKVRGIDLEASYRHNLGKIGQLNTRFIYTLALQNDSFLNPEDPHLKDQNLLELGNPKHAFNWDVSMKHGPITVGYQMRYFSKMAVGAIENIRSVQGRPPQDADAFSNDYFSGRTYHNARISADVWHGINIYAGVDNITDQLPPPSVTGISDDGGIYDNIGRFFYAGAVARF